MIKRSFAAAKNTAAFFLAVVNAFNPFYYRSLSQKALKPTIAYLLYLLLVVVLATAALTMPLLTSLDSAASSQLQKFSKLTLRAELATKEPIAAEALLLGNAKVFVNTTADPKAAEMYDIVVTAAEIRTKPVMCLFRQELCDLLGVRQHSTPIKELDLTALSGLPSAILAIMLPGLLILYYLSMVIKYSAIILAAAVLSYAVIKATKRDTSLLETVKIAAYAATSLIVIDFAVVLLSRSPFQMPAILPITAYAVMLIAALILNEQGIAERL